MTAEQSSQQPADTKSQETTFRLVEKGNRPQANRRVMFTADFDNWEPDHLHWVSPSNWVMYEDGGWFFFAKHLANMRRNNQLGADLGWDWAFDFDTEYFDKNGTRIHAARYRFTVLNYKVERDDFTATGNDARFAQLVKDIRSGKGARWLRRP
jgi:hypothetical protein